MITNSSYAEVVRRHALPEVLFDPDIAFTLGITEEEARDAACSGRLGTPFYVAGRVAVLREDFLTALGRLGTESGSRDVLDEGSLDPTQEVDRAEQ